jgi:hypothetical protein
MKVDVSYMKTLSLTNKAFSVDRDYVLNDHCHRVTTQLQLINIIIIIIKVHYLLFQVSNGHNSVTVQNRTHVYVNFFCHKDLRNHLLQ